MKLEELKATDPCKPNPISDHIVTDSIMQRIKRAEGFHDYIDGWHGHGRPDSKEGFNGLKIDG